MNSRDLYREVQDLYDKKSVSVAGILLPADYVLFSDYSEMIYDYTSRKLLEAGYQEDLVDDLGFLFDRLDEYFTSEEEKKSFYETYVHCLLIYYNSISDHAILWEETRPVNGVNYPRFKKQGDIILFQTLENQPRKDTVLWVWDDLKKKTEKVQRSKKGPTYKKDISYGIGN